MKMEIWRLGRHLLAWGDSTNKDDVLALIGNNKINLLLTDPPYGIKIQKKSGRIGGARSILRNNIT